MQHKENDFVVSALMILYDHDRKCTTAEIKDEMPNYVSMHAEDLMPYGSRSKTEPRYRQVIGNMISHKNAQLFKYIEVINEDAVVDKGTSKERIVKIRYNYLTDEGVAFVEGLISTTEKKNEVTAIPVSESAPERADSSTVVNDEVTIDLLDTRVIEWFQKHSTGGRAPTNSGVIKTVNAINNYKCQLGVLTGKNHSVFVSGAGTPYVEGHHLIPMNATADFWPRSLDRPSNIVTLCPTCHQLVHHGSDSEKRAALKILYDHYIQALNDEEIYIDFEELLKKYY